MKELSRVHLNENNRMKVERNESDLIVKIPLLQSSYDAIGEYIGKVPNIVGVVVKQDDTLEYQGFYQLNDLGYKGDIQLGMDLIKTYLDEEKFIELCKKMDIDFWVYVKCPKCKQVIWGSSTYDKEGRNIHIGCEE